MMSLAKPLLRTLVPLVALVSLSTSTHAEDDEWALSIGPSYRGLSEALADDASAFRSAPGALVRLRYGVGDFFQIGASLDVGIALPTDTSALAPVAAAFFEVHYVIDIVTWVPFVSAGVGTVLRGEVPATPEAELRVDLALTIGGGLEYRPARDWAVGFAGRYELLVTDFARADAFSLTLVYTLFFE